ncbi:MAG: prepilin-type N-terminal cleavage/methylation domain-containing protein [Gammaproteobacteria bacterium]|nr:prepilin-type N-terminal cleavage/methylation domain-containing protein [Gammaproteobacteria bacterium]
MKNKSSGFTLIELMVTVVIIGILAAIAYPSYQDSVRQSRRAAAQAALVSLGNAMERVFTQNNTYTPGGAAPTLGTAAGDIFPAQAPLDGTSKQYNLSIQPAPATTATTYTIRATPISGTSQANDGMLELDGTGAKRWDKDNGGTFSAAENTWSK